MSEDVAQTETEKPRMLAVGRTMLDRKNRTVEIDGHRAEVRPQEVRTLEILMEHAGEVVSREMLLKRLYDDVGVLRPSNKTIHVFICKLRKLYGQDGEYVIETLWGHGYRFAKEGVNPQAK